MRWLEYCLESAKVEGLRRKVVADCEGFQYKKSFARLLFFFSKGTTWICSEIVSKKLLNYKQIIWRIQCIYKLNQSWANSMTLYYR